MKDCQPIGMNPERLLLFPFTPLLEIPEVVHCLLAHNIQIFSVTAYKTWFMTSSSKLSFLAQQEKTCWKVFLQHQCLSLKIKYGNSFMLTCVRRQQSFFPRASSFWNQEIYFSLSWHINHDNNFSSFILPADKHIQVKVIFSASKPKFNNLPISQFLPSWKKSSD